MISRKRFPILLTLTAALALPLAGAFSLAPPPATGGATLGVDVFDFGYEDDSSGTPITFAKPGDTVTWSWTKGRHSVTTGAGSQGVGGALDSGVRAAGSSYSHTFETEGVFVYTCTLHASMNGIVVVDA